MTTTGYLALNTYSFRIDNKENSRFSGRIAARGGLTFRGEDFFEINLPKVIVAAILTGRFDFLNEEVNSALEALYPGLDVLPGPSRLELPAEQYEAMPEVEKAVYDFVRFLVEQNDEKRELFSIALSENIEQQLRDTGGSALQEYREAKEAFRVDLEEFL